METLKLAQINDSFVGILKEAVIKHTKLVMEEKLKESVKKYEDNLRNEIDHIALRIFDVFDVERIGHRLVITVDKSKLDNK